MTNTEGNSSSNASDLLYHQSQGEEPCNRTSGPSDHVNDQADGKGPLVNTDTALHQAAAMSSSNILLSNMMTAPEEQEPQQQKQQEKDTDDSQLSKKQMKKRKRYEKLMDIKKRKKQQAKERKHAKAIAQGRDLEEERRLQLEREKSGEGKRRREEEWKKRMETANTSFRVCIDCGFEDLMTFKELNSLASQIRYCYAANKRSDNPVYITVPSLKESGTTYEQLAKVEGFPELWKPRAFACSSEPLEQMHDVENLIYLTSDSTTTLDHLDDSKTYVIGGIVDRNRLKGITMEKANKLKIQTARLPIDDHLKLVATKVLTVNHVFEILLKYREFGNDWKKALLEVLPQRKDIQEIDTGAVTDNNEERSTRHISSQQYRAPDESNLKWGL